jgi:hypothetical protein
MQKLVIRKPSENKDHNIFLGNENVFGKRKSQPPKKIITLTPEAAPAAEAPWIIS